MKARSMHIVFQLRTLAHADDDKSLATTARDGGPHNYHCG